MPALVGRAAAGGGGGDFLPGRSAGLVLIGEQDAEGAAQDLGLAITEKLLGPTVPGGDRSRRIDRENRKVPHALDHERPRFLGLAQRCSTRLRCAISYSSSRRRASCSRLTMRERASSRSVRDLVEHAGYDRLEMVEETRRLGYEVADTGSQGLDQETVVLKPRDQDGRHVEAGVPAPGGRNRARSRCP